MKADPYVPDALGYTRATVAGTKGTEPARGRKSQKAGRGPDCSLKPGCMKQEPIVIADQKAAVNTFSGLPHIVGRVHQRRTGRNRQPNRAPAGGNVYWGAEGRCLDRFN